MENKEIKINKSIPMDPDMIKKIHKLMIEHLETENTVLSFGEAARNLIHMGLEWTDMVEKQRSKTGA